MPCPLRPYARWMPPPVVQDICWTWIARLTDVGCPPLPTAGRGGHGLPHYPPLRAPTTLPTPCPHCAPSWTLCQFVVCCRSTTIACPPACQTVLSSGSYRTLFAMPAISHTPTPVDAGWLLHYSQPSHRSTYSPYNFPGRSVIQFAPTFGLAFRYRFTINQNFGSVFVDASCCLFFRHRFLPPSLRHRFVCAPPPRPTTGCGADLTALTPTSPPPPPPPCPPPTALAWTVG